MPTLKHFLPITLAVGVTLLISAVGVFYVLRDAPLPDMTMTLPHSLHTSEGGISIASPTHLIIPVLGITSTIERVGRTEAGTMASPSNFRDVAWFASGPHPGEVGSAVIAGHLDNALGLSGVFKHLDDLHIGDRVYVDTLSGERVAFRVVRTEEYPYDHVPVDQLFGDRSGSYLNLITCAGVWLREYQTYDRRLVIYTERLY